MSALRFAPIVTLTLVAAAGCGGNTISSGSPPGGSTAPQTVTATFTENAFPTAVAYSNNGSWQMATLSAGAFSFAPANTTYRIAYVCGSNVEEVAELSVQDTTTPLLSCPPSVSTPTSTVEISVNASSIPNAAAISVTVGDRNFSSTQQVTSTSATIGPFYVFDANRFDAAVEALDSNGTLLAIKIIRGAQPGESIVLGPPDEVAGNYTFTITGAQGTFPSAQIRYITSTNGLPVPLGSVSAGNVGTLAVIPRSSSATGDIYDGIGSEQNPHPRFYIGVGTQERLFSAASDESFYPATPWPAPSATQAALPTVSLSPSSFTPSSLGGYIAYTYWNTYEFVFASKSFIGTQSSITIPDLSALKTEGFFTNPPSGVQLNYGAGAFDNSKQFALPNVAGWNEGNPVAFSSSSTPVDGNTMLSAFGQYFFTVP